MDRTDKRLIVGLGLLLILALAFSSLGGGMIMMRRGIMRPGMMGPSSGFQGGWLWRLRMGLGGFAILTYWGALIIGVLLLVRMLRREPPRGFQESPLDIVKRRYAAGEITREQFEQMRQDLER